MEAKKTISGVNIPTPCHERWDNMTPQGEGKYCGSCSKVVVDFTSMSPDQIKNYFLQKKEEKVCGHFHVTQLQEKSNLWLEDILYRWFERAHRIRVGVLRISMVAIVSFILMVTGCRSNQTHKVGKVAPHKHTEKHYMKGDIAPTEYIDGGIGPDFADTTSTPPQK